MHTAPDYLNPDLPRRPEVGADARGGGDFGIPQ